MTDDLIFGHGLYELHQKGFICHRTSTAVGTFPVWALMHRICGAMSKRDDCYGLEGMIEFDAGYFEQATKADTHQKLKRGRGSQHQFNVTVMAESTRL